MQETKNKIKSFTDLMAWQEGHKVVIMIYKITRKFPKEEIFGLISQLRRAAVSITSNIAEGFSRQYYSEKVQFYSIALGSITELQNQLLVARDVGYLDKLDFAPLVDQSILVRRLAIGLLKHSKFIKHSQE